MLVERFQLRSAASREVVANAPGIVCAGVADACDEASVLLLWDENDNPGCSLTNGVETVLGHLLKTWADQFPWSSCIAIERDSLGDFDLLRLSSGSGLQFQGWHPARWPGCEPRSWRAVESILGEKARIARQAVRRHVPGSGA